jgi:predicted translin family RNA/ssDNA-binding protein
LRELTLVQNSRDVTSLSKKVIFLLHRLALEELQSDSITFTKAAQAGKEKLLEVQQLLGSIASEVQGDQYWRYQRQVSHGVQEYIEALSLNHFLEFGTLISYDDVQKSIVGSDGVPV